RSQFVPTAETRTVRSAETVKDKRCGQFYRWPIEPRSDNDQPPTPFRRPWRILGGLAGVGVVGTATHMNVMHAGGYRSEDAPLIIAVAILVAFGMGFVSWAFSEGFRGAAVLLG